MTIENHKYQLPIFVTKLEYYPVILGIICLPQHDVAVQFATNMVTYVPQYFTPYCHDAPGTVQGGAEEPPEPDYVQHTGIFQTKI